MKKVINITLGNTVFAIENEAYEILSAYLEQIKVRLLDTDDQLEIVADIERAIAEKFVELGRSEKRAVSAVDVEGVKLQMGTPADFGDAGVQEAATPQESPRNPKKLFRDPDDRVIAGVASGIANYFSVDPVFVRVTFLVLVFLNGIGLLAYFILWLVMPVATSTAQKFSMKGKGVTVADIRARVTQKFAESELTDSETIKGAWASVRSPLNKFFDLAGEMTRVLFTAVRSLAGFGLVAGGILGAVGLVVFYSIILFSERLFLPVEVQTGLVTLLGNTYGLLAILALGIVLLIPLLTAVMAGMSILLRRNIFTAGKIISLFSVWIIALVIGSAAGAVQFEKVWQVVDALPDYSYDSDYDDYDDWEERAGRGTHGDSRNEPAAPLPPVTKLPSVSPVVDDAKDERMCTDDVKQCPDGSFVSRSPIDCSFAQCPPALAE